MATASIDFDGWLTKRLEKLNIDHEVFGSYIIGIMEADDSTEDDKTEALTDILSEISVCKQNKLIIHSLQAVEFYYLRDLYIVKNV